MLVDHMGCGAGCADVVVPSLREVERTNGGMDGLGGSKDPSHLMEPLRMVPSTNRRPMALRFAVPRMQNELTTEEQSQQLIRKRLLRYILSNHLRREAERGLRTSRTVRAR